MIMQNIEIFTSAPKAHFYDQLFLNLDLSEMPEYDSKTGRRGYSNHAKLCAFIVMKCECFSYITALLDFLQNNLIIAHYCGFDITRPLPSYWTLDHFLNQIDHDILDRVLQTQVEKLTALGMIDPSFVAIDSTPIMANTAQNNPKSFCKKKFSKENHPSSNSDCALGVHTASNQINEQNFEYCVCRSDCHSCTE